MKEHKIKQEKKITIFTKLLISQMPFTRYHDRKSKSFIEIENNKSIGLFYDVIISDEVI